MLDAFDVIALTVVSAAIVACAQYLFKRGVGRFRFNLSGIVSMTRNRWVIAGVAVYMLGLVFYLFALGSGELSFVYPAFSSTFVFVIIISHFMLKERIGYARLAGILMIIAGIALVSGIV